MCVLIKYKSISHKLSFKDQWLVWISYEVNTIGGDHPTGYRHLSKYKLQDMRWCGLVRINDVHQWGWIWNLASEYDARIIKKDTRIQ